MTSCILSMWKVLLVTNLRLGCDVVSWRPTAVTMITLITTFAFNSRFEVSDIDDIRIWIFPLLWILNVEISQCYLYLKSQTSKTCTLI